MILCVGLNGLLTRIMVTLNCSSYKAASFRGQLFSLMTSDLLYQFTLKMHNIILCFIFIYLFFTLFYCHNCNILVISSLSFFYGLGIALNTRDTESYKCNTVSNKKW